MNRPRPDTASNAADAHRSPPTKSTETSPDAASSASPATPPAVLGGYRIVRLLGEGGMGAVYRARDDKLGRDVALKTMRPEIAAQPEVVERFLRKARAIAKVAHDNVIPIWQIGEGCGTSPRPIGSPSCTCPERR